MRQLHQQLQAGRFPNCTKAAKELEVSPKTVQRDIDFMRDQLGLPIEYDQLHFGFAYTEPVTSFPCIEVSKGEIVALFVAEKALAQCRGTSFEKPLHAAFQKIADGLQDKVSVQWSDLDAAISFRGGGATATDLELFEAVSSAVLKSHEVTFEYRKLKGRGYEPRRVQPYHLGCIDQQWRSLCLRSCPPANPHLCPAADARRQKHWLEVLSLRGFFHREPSRRQSQCLQRR